MTGALSILARHSFYRRRFKEIEDAPLAAYAPGIDSFPGFSRFFS
jgi:hypothetical protein